MGQYLKIPRNDMMTAHPVLSPDKPLIDPTQDRLGFTPYAAFLAKVLIEQCPHSGLVIAVCGAWGTGKSTVIN